MKIKLKCCLKRTVVIRKTIWFLLTLTRRISLGTIPGTRTRSKVSIIWGILRIVWGHLRPYPRSLALAWARKRGKGISSSIRMLTTTSQCKTLGSTGSPKTKRTPHQCLTTSLSPWAWLKRVRVQCKTTIALPLTARPTQAWTCRFITTIMILTLCLHRQIWISRTESRILTSPSQWLTPVMIAHRFSAKKARFELAKPRRRMTQRWLIMTNLDSTRISWSRSMQMRQRSRTLNWLQILVKSTWNSNHSMPKSAKTIK